MSHAYLVECADKEKMRDYLKLLAKLILTDGEEGRTARLIDREIHPDVTFYPPVGGKLKASMADEITSDCLIKPLELKVRTFVVSGFEGFEKSQNKLLKTLEEPPENVILLLGTSNINAILPTVKSRVKKVEIPPFTEAQLFEALCDKFDDKDKFENAVRLSNGLEGNVYGIYERGDVEEIKTLAQRILRELDTSRSALKCASYLKNVDVALFINVLKMLFHDMLRMKNGGIGRLNCKNSDLPLEKYKTGAIIEIIETLGEIERATHFNANRTMVVDKLLFTCLEAKYKWQKL